MGKECLLKRRQGAKDLCLTKKCEKQRCERGWDQVLTLCVSPRSQAARGKEKEKDGTTDSGIKLEPVPGLPGGECRLPAHPVACWLQMLTLSWRSSLWGETSWLGLAPAAALFSQQEPRTYKRGNSVARLSSLWLLALFCSPALPPPPAAEEEASANYFNLPPSGPPAVVNIALPPPPGIAPPPPPGNVRRSQKIGLT